MSVREAGLPAGIDRPVRRDLSVLTLNLAMAVTVWAL